MEYSDAPARDALLRVENLRTAFPIRSAILQRRIGEFAAVKDVSFSLDSGKTLGLVGESGSGKSTLARSIVGLVQPTGGQIFFNGVELTSAGDKQIRHLRRDMQMIFQDPQASLNPRLTAAQIIAEAWRVHPGVVPREDWHETACELLRRVGLDPVHADRYPHQFSGGQRQRIGIARALALRPKLIICDEVVSALDVSVQAQVLNLLRDLQDEFGLTYLFITHDLSVVRHMSDDILVMCRGEPVEYGPADEVLATPTKDYTRALLSAVPVLRPWAT